jgi:hypothetical protein
MSIEGFDPVVPLLVSECYTGRRHEWIVVYESDEITVVKCSICLEDKVFYNNLPDVAEKLWGYLKRRDK